MPTKQEEFDNHEPLTLYIMQWIRKLETERVELTRNFETGGNAPDSPPPRVKVIDFTLRALTPILYWMGQLELFSPEILRMEQYNIPSKKKAKETKTGAFDKLAAAMRELPPASNLQLSSWINNDLFNLRYTDQTPLERAEVALHTAALAMTIYKNNCERND